MKGQPLSSFVDALRQEIDQAQESALQARRQSALKMEKIILSVQVVAEQEKGASGGVNFFAVTLGTELKQASSRTHAVTFEFTPLRKIPVPKGGGGGGGTVRGQPIDWSALGVNVPDTNTEDAAATVRFSKIVLGSEHLDDPAKEIILHHLLRLESAAERRVFMRLVASKLLRPTTAEEKLMNAIIGKSPSRLDKFKALGAQSFDLTEDKEPIIDPNHLEGGETMKA